MWLHILDHGGTMCARGSQEYESICNAIFELLWQHLWLRQPQKNRNYREVKAEGSFKGEVKKSHLNMGKKLQRNHPRSHIEKLTVFPSITKLFQDQWLSVLKTIVRDTVKTENLARFSRISLHLQRHYMTSSRPVGHTNYIVPKNLMNIKSSSVSESRRHWVQICLQL